jgi:3-hydroxybutyryl-CoA dehydratase
VSALDWSAPFSSLEPGQRFRSRARTITETDIVGFSAATGDTHPQHTDAEWAASSRFGERIAHGMLVLSYAIGLIPFDPARVLALRRIDEVVFKRPAKIGDTIHLDGTLTARRALSDVGLVSLRCDIRNGSELLLCRAQIEVLWSDGVHDAPPAANQSEIDPLDLPRGVIPC